MVDPVPLSGAHRRGRWRFLLALPPLAFLAVFFVWPVVSIIERGLRPDGAWDFGAFGDVWSDPSIRRVMWFTLWESVASTALCLIVGLPGAAIFARYRFRGKRIVWAALLVPFVLPTVVVGVAFLGLIGDDGALGFTLTGSVWAVLLAHVFFNYAVVVRTVGATWSTLDPRIEEAARTLGASRPAVFRSVTWPVIGSSVMAASSIVFLFSFTSFGVVLLLGGISTRTLEVEIFEQTARMLHLDVAAVLALVQLVAVVGVLWWFTRSQRRRAVTFDRRAARETERPARGVGPRMFVGANLSFMALLLALPLLVLIIRSFDTPNGWGFGAYRALNDPRNGSTSFVPPLDAVANSLWFATLATVLAITLGTCAAVAIAGGRNERGSDAWWSPWMDTALMIPLGTSAVTIGFGFLLTFDHAPIDLRSSIWLVPIAHSIVAMPFVVRLLVPALRSIDPRLREAAATLGASPIRAWFSVEAPIVGRAFAAAAGFAFAVSLGEFGATAFLARPGHPTVPIAIYRALGRPGEWQFGQAMALSTILMVVTVVVILGIDRLRPVGAAEF